MDNVASHAVVPELDVVGAAGAIRDPVGIAVGTLLGPVCFADENVIVVDLG